MLKGEDENPSTRTKVHFSRRPQWMLPESQAEAHRWGQGNAKGRKHRLGGKRAKLSQEEERKREALQASREA